MASINLWYIAAIFLGACAAFCGYYGAVIEGKKNSDEQSSRIEDQLKTLADEIQKTRDDPTSAVRREKVSELQNRYNQIAEEFFRNLPLKAAEHRSQKATEAVEELRRSSELRAVFEKVRDESKALAGAFNRSAGREAVTVASSEFPKNIFQQDQGQLTYILFQFGPDATWAFRLIFQDATPAFQLIRLDPRTAGKPYEEQGFTNDSINLVVLPETFFISLNTHISSEVRGNVVGTRAGTEIPKVELADEAAALVRRMIEFAIVAATSNDKNAT